MRYGYFIAETGTEYGDPELSRWCRERWATLGHPKPQPLDGASCWINDSGPNMRLLARDFFSTTPRVAQAMVHAS